MKKSLLTLLLAVGMSFFAESQEKDTATTQSKIKPKFILAFNLGAATLDYKPAFCRDLIYGLKFKRHSFTFNYSSNNLIIKDKSITLLLSKPMYDYQNFGYVHYFDLLQQENADLALKLGVHYAEFGVKDLSTTSFFHTGNMLFIDRLVSFTPGVNYHYKLMNFEVEYRYSLGLRKSNVYEPKMTNGLTAKLGIRISK